MRHETHTSHSHVVSSTYSSQVLGFSQEKMKQTTKQLRTFSLPAHGALLLAENLGGSFMAPYATLMLAQHGSSGVLGGKCGV